MPEYCSVCKQSFETTKRCTKCHCIRYCSKPCQKEDWNYHKVFCKSFGAFWKSQQDKFENLNEPLSSKMLEFWITTNEHVNKVKQVLPRKSLAVIGVPDESDGFSCDIKCFPECESLFSETELCKIRGIPNLFECEVTLVVYKLHVGEKNYELIHVATMESGK